jgi:murein tripeptide amidase MpaA
MLSKRLILFLSLTSMTLLSEAQERNSDYLLRETIRQFGQVSVTIPLTSVQSIEVLTLNVSITDVRDKSVYIILSKSTVEWFILQNFEYTIQKREDTKSTVTALTVAKAMDWHSYPSYTQYDSIMHYFSTSFPAICHLDTIGKSINGKYVLVLKISDNVNVDEDEPEVFYSSSIHGDETGGYVLMLRLADYLTKNYTVSEEVRNLVNGLEIYINPLANPDGTYASGNEIVYPTRGNSNGIDLNRNFPDPGLPSMVIEKENKDMVGFMKKHNFVLSANFHAGAEVVNYPWDRWYSRIHADDSWFNSISREYADTVHNYSGPFYMSYLENGVTRGAKLNLTILR